MTEKDQESDIGARSIVPSFPLPRKGLRKEEQTLDALSSYLREVRQYPRLAPNEERELALRYFREKDLDAAYKLVSSNLWLVVKIAREYERAAKNILDLIQEGNIGLMEAVKNFDPFKEVRFPSYAVWWIKAYIIKYVIANWRLVKVGTTQAQRKLFFNLQKEKDRLEREGIFPTPKLIAENLDVREKDVVEMEQRLAAGDLSLDAPVTDEGDTSLMSVLPSQGASVEDAMLGVERAILLRSALDDFASTLTERDRSIFEKRMLAEDKETLQELSDQLHLSRERIRQIESKIQEKLKEFLKRRFGESLGEIIDI
jgi:RNA polymerase sigma-32 factor